MATPDPPGMSQNAGTASQRPPRAPLALRIGVTGHRVEAPGEEAGGGSTRPRPDLVAIHETLRKVLGVIRDSFRGVGDTNACLFDLGIQAEDQAYHGTLRVISALAAGADQWVADEALQCGFDLQAILPFDREEYARDFSAGSALTEYQRLLGRASAVFELDGRVDHDDQGNRRPDSRSYEAVGRAILHQTDLLIAVWDGQPASGRGGTGQVVQEALQRGIPVVWIPWNTPRDWRLQKPVWRLLEHPEDTMGDPERLGELVRELLLPPDDDSDSGVDGEEGLCRAYFDERQKHGNPQHGLWLIFRNVVCGELFSAKGVRTAINSFFVTGFEQQEAEASREDWREKKSVRKAATEHPFDESKREWVDSRFVKHYAWANGLSMYYGNLHRSAFVVTSLFGALAVLLALVPVGLGIAGRAQAPWVAAELVVIIAILALAFTGRMRSWHQRWIDYRTLAERLRLARCLSLLGGGGPEVVFVGHMTGHGNPIRNWMHWHYLAIERAAGVIPAKVTGGYLAAAQEFWRESLLQDQRHYHAMTATRFRKLDRRLQFASASLFVATMAACALHVAHGVVPESPRFDWLPSRLPGVLTLLCASLPACGAACAAIRSQCEAQRLAQNSQAMERALERLQLSLASAPVAEGQLNSQRLRGLADQVSELMIRETLDWRVVFQDRPLGLSG